MAALVGSQCFTAVDSLLSTQSMLLNVTYESAPQMAVESYKLIFSFPASYVMGPQPYRAPQGTVKCKPAVVVNQTQTIACTSDYSPRFYAVFIMDTNGTYPSSNVQMSIVNNDRSLILGVLKKTCPAVILPVGAIQNNATTNAIPNGYLVLPGLGPEPPWVVTLIFGAIGLGLGIILYCYARHRTRARRESLQAEDRPTSDPFGTAKNTPTISPKISDEGNLNRLEATPNLTLMQQLALQQQKNHPSVSRPLTLIQIAAIQQKNNSPSSSGSRPGTPRRSNTPTMD
ncbi:hypothetical protein HDU98_010899 [Podochytrium sp. JEL0797]|nr:hypothetical protein HDU98_010899 [Podochytrium sp. JEL0797]